MKILPAISQGSVDWHMHRATARNASEAPAVMGFSKYKTRSELLHEKATGVKQSIDASTQRRFDDGHRAEAAARPAIEAMIGGDLYPVTATSDDGYLSASFDGITICESTIWENKLFNQGLADYIEQNLDLPDSHWPQVEQQLMISNADECIFTLSSVTGEIKRSLSYKPLQHRQQAVLAAWQQFDDDLANHQPAEVVAEAVGRAPDALPALRIEVTGMVTASNLDAFKAGAALMFSRINRDLQTDQDFADAEKAVKHCKEVEDGIEAAKRHALSQTASIDELYRALDSVSAEARSVRLELDKLVKARKENIRIEIQQEAELAFKVHIDTINARLKTVQLPPIRADFAGVMKGKKTVASLRDACDTELARVKIEASQLSEHIGINLDFCSRVIRAEEKHLFHDLSSLVLKPQADMEAIIKMRIKEESDRIDAVAAAKIEAEKAARERAEAAAAAKIEADRQASVRAQMREQEVSEGIPQPVPAPVIEQAPMRRAHATAPVTEPATKRPSDKQIIFAVATAFSVDYHTARSWIADLAQEVAA
jgi:putative phage-type endonuclease